MHLKQRFFDRIGLSAAWNHEETSRAETPGQRRLQLQFCHVNRPNSIS